MAFNIFGNATEETSWVPNPTTRGTSNILLPCLITISLCVWSALHLNIQGYRDGEFIWMLYQTWRKSGWVIVGLLAPEFLIYTAWYQRCEAKLCATAFNNTIGITPPPGTFSIGARLREGLKKAVPNQQRPWTIAQGFYIQMGGIAFGTIEQHPISLLQGHAVLDRKTFLSVLGAIDLPEANAPDFTAFRSQLDISEEDLVDKRKGSGIAKALVCLQAIWFCLQCFARVLQQLPLSLLELNTFAHSLCALVVYILWWEKPLDVERPTYLTVSSEREIYLWAREFPNFCYQCLESSESTVRETFIQPILSFFRTRRYGVPTAEPRQWIELTAVDDQAIPSRYRLLNLRTSDSS
ncbi:uncharacterized protein B0I36DRAFT_257457 [Microdochium trichocladiopsis]|uniref:Uncharacterized protein n=1 Tax=Microdochium trichocladiopsis TaxID=1682393 RepID=A0A9P8XSU2_9PEZI|nr:uncharacterized protein B0I36DRAFT_257457 [Microdochium trichocladiopsis]KAH7010588.1 hypothetical protein B0I36DRAFT_257457 [Microdochium trichocladiopsis]